MLANRRKCKVWTTEEDEKLLRLAEEGRSRARISVALKRSREGVQNRLNFLRRQAVNRQPRREADG